MANRPTVDYQSAKDLLLFRLQFALAKYEDIDNSFEALSSLLKMPLPLVKISAGHLEEKQFCKIRKVETMASQLMGSTQKHEEEILEITAAGVDEVQKWLPERYREVAQRSDLTISDWQFEDSNDALTDPSGASFALGESLLGDDLTQASDSVVDDGVSSVDRAAPASDRTVTIDHNSDPYKSAVEALDRVVQEFKADHRVDNELGAQKTALTSALEAGKEYLTDTEIRVRIAFSLIIEPLRMLVEKYDQVLVGALAATALAAIVKLLGLG